MSDNGSPPRSEVESSSSAQSGSWHSDARSPSVASHSLTASTNPSMNPDTGLLGGVPAQAKPSATIPSTVTVRRGLVLPPTSNPVIPFIKNYPPSKTAVGRLTYQLDDLPKLFAAEARTHRLSETSDQKPDDDSSDQNPDDGPSDQNPDDRKDKVKHKKLRIKALKEALEQPMVAFSAVNTAIVQDSDRSFDHLVRPGIDDDAISNKSVYWTVNLERVGKVVKNTGGKNRSDTSRQLQCRIAALDDDLNKKATEKSLLEQLSCTCAKARQSSPDS